MAKLVCLLVTLLVCLIPFASAQVSCVQTNWTRPNDQSISSVNAASYGCTAQCQAILNGAIEEDRIGLYGAIPFDTAFYATSAKFSPSTSKPGDLLKVSKLERSRALFTYVFEPGPSVRPHSSRRCLGTPRRYNPIPHPIRNRRHQ